jgi:hypothetical protein
MVFRQLVVPEDLVPQCAGLVLSLRQPPFLQGGQNSFVEFQVGASYPVAGTAASRCSMSSRGAVPLTA